MSSDATVILIQDQMWFEPFIELNSVPAFPKKVLGEFTTNEWGEFNARFLLGRGPVKLDLGQSVQIYFSSGDNAYPIFGSPIVGPSGGGLYASSEPQSIEVDKNCGLFLILLTAAYRVSEEYVEQVVSEFEAMRSVDSPAISKEMAELLQIKSSIKESSEKIAGAYALYQPSMVWKKLRRIQTVRLYHDGEFKGLPVKQSINIPVLIDPISKMESSRLKDGVAENAKAVASSDLLLPFRCLLEATSVDDPILRFLNYFWILEHLSMKKCGSLLNSAEVRTQFDNVLEAVSSSNTSLGELFRSWKFRIVRKDLIDAVKDYHDTLGLVFNYDLCNEAKRIRNKMSHGQEYDQEKLLDIEPQLGHLVRTCLRKELEASGVFLDK